MKPKLFMLIAGDLAAEQRAVVAHSASYGYRHPHISQAPAGAAENYFITAQIFSRPVRGLNCFLNNVPDAVGYFLSLLRSYYRCSHIVPTAHAVGYYRTPLRG